MANDQQLQFDIAYALSILSSQGEIPFGFPKVLEVTPAMRDMLGACIDPSSFSGPTCRIRDDFSGIGYTYRLGNDEYTLPAHGMIRAGGSGVTLPIFDKKVNRQFALKVPRVSVLAYQVPDYRDLDEKDHFKRVMSEYKTFEHERNVSRRIIHQNVAQAFYGGQKPITEGRGGIHVMLPYSISEWVDGVPLHEFLQNNSLDIYEIISLISDTFAGLAHVHAQKVLHWDIKADNLLVTQAKTAKIINFGNAKLLDVLSPEDLQVTTTQDKYPELDDLFEVASTGEGESRRFRIRVPDLSWNHPYIDIWMLAQEWNRCLGLSENYVQGHEDIEPTRKRELANQIRGKVGPRLSETYDCLRIIFDRILFPFFPKHRAKFIGITNNFDPEKLYYKSAEEVLAELRRIRPPFGAAERIPELLVTLDDIVRLPVTGNSVFTERVALLVDTPIIAPSKRHLQLAQVRQIFPGATHTRFEHLLGTVGTASYFVRSLYLNDMNAFWRVSTEAADVRAVLFAALLHDAGHLAFGHFIEEMTDLMEGARHLDFIITLLRQCIDELEALIKGNPVRIVADPGNFDITMQDKRDIIDSVKSHWCSEVPGHKGSDREAQELLERVLRLFAPEAWLNDEDAYLFRRGTRVALEHVLRSIIDGPIDADKLDYLRRDSFHSGVFFASGIDLERFFESLRVCIYTGQSRHTVVPSIGVSEKGIALLKP